MSSLAPGRAPSRDISRPLVVGAGVVTVLVLAAVAAFVHPLVAVVAALGLLVLPVVLAHRTLALAGVVAVVGLLPFAAIPLNVGFNPTLLDLALGAVYLIWVMRLVTRQNQGSALASPLAIAVVLFMGLAVVAFCVGLTQGMPSKNQIRTFGELVLAAGLFVVVLDLVRDAVTLRRVVRLVVGVCATAAAIGLLLYVLPDSLQMQLLSTLRVLDYPSGPAVLRFINDDPARLQRATGTSIDPNAFGGLLAVALAFLLPQLLSRAPLVPRRLAWLMAAVMGLAVLATVSRAALLGAVAGAVVVALAWNRRLLVWGALGAAVGLALAVALPWSRAYLEHFLAGLVGEDRATQMRFGEYKDAFRLIGRYPMFGVGFGDVRDVDLYRGVSSLYLIIASSMGLLGLSGFLGLMAAIGTRLTLACRRLGRENSLGSVVLGSLAALVAVLVSGFFDHYFFTYPHEFALLWLVLGLGVAAARLGEAETEGGTAGS